jgi:hypothetical protein
VVTASGWSSKKQPLNRPKQILGLATFREEAVRDHAKGKLVADIRAAHCDSRYLGKTTAHHGKQLKT